MSEAGTSPLKGALQRRATVKKYVVELTEVEREYLYKLISAGSASARMLNRARIPLKTDVGKHSEGGPLIDRERAPMLSRPTRPRCSACGSVFAGRGSTRRSNAR
jgi:hypothetical protein